MGMLWDKFVEKAKDIDAWRKLHLSMAEWMDAWRVVPRLLVAAYAYLLWKVMQWYMTIEPHMIKGCPVDLLKEQCISQAPTTQDAVIVTAAVGIAAAVFGMYSGSGRKWNGFTHWNKLTDKSGGE